GEAHDLAHRDAGDVPHDDAAARQAVVDLELGELLPARTANPDELAIVEQPRARLVGVHLHQRPALRVARAGAHEPDHLQWRIIACHCTPRATSALLMAT